ncbi:MAG TPA: DUF2784 domain-containing protein [Smithella sp.]|nr:DUF2784 domain-containing protein [Smithella sp.]
MYHILADILVAAHFLFILFVVFGGLLVIRKPSFAWVHLPAALWGAVVEIFGWICPLTPLENHLRTLAGESVYSGDFIARYLLFLIYPENLTPSIQKGLGAGVIVINLIFYFIAFKKNRARR